MGDLTPSIGRRPRRDATAYRVGAEIEAAAGRAGAVAANLASEQERADLIARAEQQLGPLDILVNNVAAGDVIRVPRR